MKLIKRIAPKTILPLVHICNLSIETGVFLDGMKKAKITPIYKAGEERSFTNYRHVSLFLQLSKILEKLINNRITNFITKNNILVNQQYGFRAKNSTSFAILDLINTITNAQEKGEIGVGVFIDIAKAVDTVPHEILLEK